MILTLKTYSGLLIFVANESLSLLFQLVIGFKLNTNNCMTTFFLMAKYRDGNFWSWFFPSRLEKGLQLLLT